MRGRFAELPAISLSREDYKDKRWTGVMTQKSLCSKLKLKLTDGEMGNNIHHMDSRQRIESESVRHSVTSDSL